MLPHGRPEILPLCNKAELTQHDHARETGTVSHCGRQEAAHVLAARMFNEPH
jgi:hypothetical protein